MTSFLALALLPSLAGGGGFAVPSSQLAQLPPSVEYGEYAVGVATSVAVDNRQRFDPWNAVYGRPEYRALIRRIEASGQRRAVVFQLWYPAEPDPDAGAGRPAGPRSPLPAASGRRANYFDLFFQDYGMAVAAMRAMIPPGSTRVAAGGTLAELEGPARQAELERLAVILADRFTGAWQDARAAQGAFPLIVLAHGLGGYHGLWVSLGEFLASHGYVVAAPTFVSDGTPAMVFHDEDSPYAKQAEPGELRRSYQMLTGEPKVVPYFYRLLFGAGGGGQFDLGPGAAAIVPGGEEQATMMMRNLFRQRVSDLGLVLRTVRLLGEDPETCRTALSAMGATSAARYLCAILDGRVDGGPAGLAGHSLGSMTAQLGATYLPGIAAAAGLNNGPPFTWSPREMLAGEGAPEGAPGGIAKPLLLVIGNEDAFVQRVFTGLFRRAVGAAGGDPAKVFPLEAERALPDPVENPQPVALSAWSRAMSSRVLVTVRDVNHTALVEDAPRYLSWPAFQRGDIPFGADPRRLRKPTGPAVLEASPEPGEPFDLLGWTVLEDHGEAYLPHLVRDWYLRAWFDWHLKGDLEARRRLEDGDPFGDVTRVRMDLRRP